MRLESAGKDRGIIVRSIYPVSSRILNRHSSTILDVEAHDPADPESPDRLWVERTDSDLCEGEYVATRKRKKQGNN